MRPSVTIAIPTRNRADFLGAALESALRAVGPHDQVVVSDNASTDSTSAVLAAISDERVTVLRQTRDLGMVGNWNACLAAAREDAFLLLSDDDLVDPGALDALGAALGDATIALAYGRTRIIDEAGRERSLGHMAPVREGFHAFVQAWFHSERTIYPCAALLRVADLRAAAGYRESFGPYADVGAWLGVLAANPGRAVGFVPSVVADYRVHDQALSAGSLDTGLAGLAEVERHFGVACGAGSDRGFARLRSHYIASALRRRATTSAWPLVAYGAQVLRHLPLVLSPWAPGPYWRQAFILAAPALYERQKRRRAAAMDGAR